MQPGCVLSVFHQITNLNILKMKRTLLLFICAYSFLISSCLAQSLDINTKQYLEKRFGEYSKDYPGVSITVIQGEDILWRKDVGQADIDEKLKVTPKTKFNIYSTSKYILGLAYLKLTVQGKISVDQKIRDIDPTLPVSYDEITIKHLLTHTSGIRHYEGRKDWIRFAELNPISPGEAIEYFINDPLKSEPGEKEIYSTYGMVLASHLLEKITNKDFETAINDLLRFSEPLELDGIGANKAANYIKKGKKIDVNAKSKYGGGGFLASSDQLAEAGQMLFNESIAPLEDIKMIFKSQWKKDSLNGVAFGTGAGIAKESFGQSDVFYFGLGGGSPGGRSYLFVVADLKLSVAITANLEGDGDDAYQLAFDFIKKLTGID